MFRKLITALLFSPNNWLSIAVLMPGVGICVPTLNMKIAKSVNKILFLTSGILNAFDRL
jgi:hypothetical protein